MHPSASGRNWVFALLQVYPAAPSSFQPASAVRAERARGAEFASWTVLIVDEAERARSVSYVSRGSGKRRHLIIGLPALRVCTVRTGERLAVRLRTSAAGAAVFELPQEGETRVHVSIRQP